MRHLNVQDFQESIHTLRCAARAKRIHEPSNQDPDTKKQMCAKMDDEIRTLHYLMSDLTKNTAHSSTEPIRQLKESPDEAEGLHSIRETARETTRDTSRDTDGRSSLESVLQVSSLQINEVNFVVADFIQEFFILIRFVNMRRCNFTSSVVHWELLRLLVDGMQGCKK